MKNKGQTKRITAALCTAVILFSSASCDLSTIKDPDGSLVVIPLATLEATDAGNAVEPQPTEATTAEPLEAPPAMPEPQYPNVLTGELEILDASNLLPLAVVVDNCSAALESQSGILESDVLYETLVAPGVTRFLSIYADYRTTGVISNLRSARASDLKIAAQYGAVLACNGYHSSSDSENDFLSVRSTLGNSAYINTMREPAWTSESSELLGTIRRFDGSGRSDISYETLLTPEAIEYVLASQKYSEFTKSGGTFEGEVKNAPVFSDQPIAGKGASRVTLTFTASGGDTALVKSVSFGYNEESGKYARYEGFRPHTDSETGEQLEFSNVLALLTDVKYIDGDSDENPLTVDIGVYGSGTGYYFNGGKYVSVIWVNTADGGLKFYTATGELLLLDGNTYIAYLDRKNASAVGIDAEG